MSSFLDFDDHLNAQDHAEILLLLYTISNLIGDGEFGIDGCIFEISCETLLKASSFVMVAM